MSTTKNRETNVETKIALINRKIAELRKNVALSEWELQEKKINTEINKLKEIVKESRSFLKKKTKRNASKQDSTLQSTPIITYPPGSKTAEEATQIYDLKIIDLTKQFDRLFASFSKSKAKFDELLRKKAELIVLVGDPVENDDRTIEKSTKIQKPPQTLEEGECKKKILQLENEIHAKNVQYIEAEYIRKKYSAIKASLWNDAEKFEKSLLELESSLREQQANINRIQEVHTEAIRMKDGMSIVLSRYEHQAHTLAKSRERQAIDFRAQVEERKSELERLERKLFASYKTVAHQASTESLLDEPQAGHSEREKVNQSDNEANNLEAKFKVLMSMSGAVSPEDVQQRFVAQKEATSRLNYLRSVTEVEKKHLETQRESLLSELESTKFTDLKESEVNQEHLETLKKDTNDLKRKEQEILQSVNHSRKVLNAIVTTIIDFILKLREIDEIFASSKLIDIENNVDFDRMENSMLLKLLEDELKRGMVLAGDGIDLNVDSGHDTDAKETIDSPRDSRKTTDIENITDLNLKLDELHVPCIATPTSRIQSAISSNRMSPGFDASKPSPLPICYENLLTGTAGVSSSVSMGQNIQQISTDEECEIPSRNYLKRQALVIVDTKSRRKGYRKTNKGK